MTERPSPFAAGRVHSGSVPSRTVGSNTDSPWTGAPTGRDGHPDGFLVCDGPIRFDPLTHPPLDIERLARMASVDGQWWQGCDRQMRRRATVWHYWLYVLMGAGIGLAISAAGVAYQTLG